MTENKKLIDLVTKLSQEPNKLASSVIRILNSTDNAYQKLD